MLPWVQWRRPEECGGGWKANSFCPILHFLLGVDQQRQQPTGRYWPGHRHPQLLGFGNVKASSSQGARQIWAKSCQVSDHGTWGWDHLLQWPLKTWGQGTKLGWDTGDASSPARQQPLTNMLSRIIQFPHSSPFLGFAEHGLMYLSAWLLLMELGKLLYIF